MKNRLRVPPILDDGKLVRRLRAARHLALMLDYDGTLRPIAPRPQDGLPGPELLDILRRLKRRPRPEAVALGAPASLTRPRTTLAIVSGRPLKDLTRMIPLRGISWIGTHGLEVRAPGGRVERTADVSRIVPALRVLRDWILPHLDDSFTLEDKRVSLSLHTRVAHPAKARAVTAKFISFFEQARRLAPQLEMIHGNKVLEVRMRGVDKGTGITYLLKRHVARGAQVVCIGDDRTDEDMFRAVNALGGVTILVGARPSLARQRLPDVDAVLALLWQISGASGTLAGHGNHRGLEPGATF